MTVFLDKENATAVLGDPLLRERFVQQSEPQVGWCMLKPVLKAPKPLLKAPDVSSLFQHLKLKRDDVH